MNLEENVDVTLDEDELQFSKEQDYDDDVIIPDEIARPLVVSSHLLLVTSIISLVYAIIYHWRNLYGVFVTTLLLYVTSVWHWHKPRFSSVARRMDYIAVAVALIYGSYLAFTLSLEFKLIWFLGLGLVGVIFTTNEYLYYVTMRKTIKGDNLEPLPSRMIEKSVRKAVYIRTTWVHLICVHVLANTLALILIIGGEKSRA